MSDLNSVCAWFVVLVAVWGLFLAFVRVRNWYRGYSLVELGYDWDM